MSVPEPYEAPVAIAVHAMLSAFGEGRPVNFAHALHQGGDWVSISAGGLWYLIAPDDADWIADSAEAALHQFPHATDRTSKMLPDMIMALRQTAKWCRGGGKNHG